ncbi:glycoside hydrolase family 2 TIM barrel-domain containing protein [Pararcticibacter amylolyticus]|uniref:Glycoside hydrolase family 2 n=1 Tax=Pararcticibacter amylolyticus TaxID=2173175 RepID=A0A2U2PGH0_9SPHI|nr:glycoside hydrolase family 2 TIM barrel-domain containing protein [Pararcticibacter amylolyticus]PWG80507.1 glycoside hydrolase family 2 [Pararcticibacter amylolyticus]
MKSFANFIAILLIISNPLYSRSLDGDFRVGKISLNDNWKFTKDPQGKGLKDNASLQWQDVSFPHTWNAHDVMDDDPGYFRGIGWYKKKIKINPELKGKQLFLYFDGANQQTEVWVNGKIAGKHTGGYTRFCIPISNCLDFNSQANNEIILKVDNSHNENIPPLSADFTFFGGVYRNVYLVVKDDVYFDLTDYASNGIYVSTPSVSEKSASVLVRSKLNNSAANVQRILIETILMDSLGNKVTSTSSSLKLAAGSKAEISQEMKGIHNPHLWSPDNPYLYKVVSRIFDARSKRQIDEVINPLGFRWFRFDPDEGFFLNGKRCKLIGTSRHQDYKNLGNAIPAELHIRDIELLKEMGGNFLRIAHYPQDPVILEMCDKLGILASVEIPVVNAITESEEFYNNCREMQIEMIRQNYNHPAVILWAYMNEVLLKPKFGNDAQRQEAYYKNIKALVQNLEDLTRKEDPTRYTFVSNHGAYDLYKKVGLTSIPMVIGWNLYQGWYGDKIEGFGQFLDKFHKENPGKPLMVTEYGADADPRLRTFNPLRFDKTVEYASFYHEVYLKEIQKRDFVAGAAVWNLADFNSEPREETMPHMNNKGLLTWDRKPKDIYYLYQAALLKKPFVRIASRGWNLRSGIAMSDKDLFCLQKLKVYTNQKEVTLIVNGKDLGTKTVEDHIGEWDVPFLDGVNSVEAIAMQQGVSFKDYTEIDFKLLPYNLSSGSIPFKEMNIISGTQRFFVDDQKYIVWIPDQPYRPGSWGYTGGKPFKLNNGNKDGYGSDRNIKGTFDDPLFQTQQVGITEYRLDVPDGLYHISLYFSELNGGKEKAPLLYNLNNTVAPKTDSARVFDVSVNGKQLIDALNIKEEAGINRGIIKSTAVLVEGGKGIGIKFNAVEGDPVLNALQVRKVF